MKRTLLKNADAILQSADRTLFHADLLIGDERIEAVGKDLSAPDAETVDCAGMLLCPGFINLHTHVYQNMLKGHRDDLRLAPWCEEVTFPFVGTALSHAGDAEDPLPYHYGMLAGIEQLHSGITTFAAMDMISDALFQSWLDLGVRGVGAIQSANRWIPEEFVRPDEKMLEGVERLIDRWDGRGLLRTAIAPSTAFCCTESYLRLLAGLADRRKQFLCIHVSETRTEIAESLRDTGKTPVGYLDSIGFLDRPVLAVHCVHVDENDLKTLKSKPVTVCHNPKSNCKLGSGIAPVVRMQREGIPVCVATDGAASNDLLDMFEEMRVALLLQKGANEDPAVLSPKDVFRMATETPARALGLDAGVLEPGKQADVLCIDRNAPSSACGRDPLTTLVYCAKAADVVNVYIAGKAVLKDRAVTTLDERKAVSRAIEIGNLRHAEAFRSHDSRRGLRPPLKKDGHSLSKKFRDC
jgi:5-methylthioadenosine/S-adenosylhomocysteine deaminase